MNRIQKLKLNSTFSLLNKIVSIISGLILPKFILLYYGSETNGLIASVNQFLSIITFLDLGVGSVVLSALYRPLAKKDIRQISKVIIAAKNYFQKIAFILIIYVIGVMFFYPTLVDSSQDYLSTVFLIFGLSISLFGKYYFGIVNELLLTANQDGYIKYITDIVVTIINLIISTILITQGASIQIVKISAGLIFIARPIYYKYYVNKNFNLNLHIDFQDEPLPQKWNGMGQHIAYTLQNSTDIVILTLFSTLENVSIYTLYNMVVQAISLLISSLTTGIGSFFGDLYAKDEFELLNDYFTKIEWGVHTSVIYLFGITAVLINPFIMLYTFDIKDLNYYAPIFSFILILARVFYVIRGPYQTMIFSAGHFKETQVSSFVEAGINIIISGLIVSRYGLIGIAFGTLISMLYRLLYLVIYLSKNILHRPLKKTIKLFLVDTINFGFIIMLGIFITNFISINSIIDWIIAAIIIGISSLFIIVIINLIFYKDLVYNFSRKLL